MMKKFICTIMAVAMVLSMMAGTAFAGVAESSAQMLYDFGLFKGTDAGFELDKIPSRETAAVMLVRFLGKEAEALKQNNPCKFTDVADWAKPHVAWLNANGMANGKDDGTFGAKDDCTQQQYATFILRALGYSDVNGKDFTYDTALAFANGKGIILFESAAFDRADMATMSALALVADVNGKTDVTLLDTLIVSGAVDIAKVEAYNKDREAQNAIYKELNDISKKQGGAKLQATIDATLATVAKDPTTGADIKIPATMKGEIKALDGDKGVDKTKVSVTMETTTMGTTQTIKQVMPADGFIYSETAQGKFKQAMPAEEMKNMIESLTNMGLTSEEALPFGSTISKKDNVYTLVLAGDQMTAIMANPMFSSLAGGTDTAISDITATFKVVNGMVESVNMEFAVAMKDPQVGMITSEINMTMKYVAAGDFTITAPTDAADYVLAPAN